MEQDFSQPGPSGVKRPLPTINNNQVNHDATPSSGLKNTLHGNIFQLKLLVLFLVRGIKAKYDFQLATERPDLADKFDDLIFKYKTENTWKYRFLQAKHKQKDDDKIKTSHLLDESEGDFSLLKYFSSYRNTIKVDQDNIDDCVIATNIGFDKEDLRKNGILLIPVVTSDVILKFNENIRYKLKFQNKNVVYEKFRHCSISSLLAKKMIDCVTKNKKIDLRDELFKSYHVALVKEKVVEVLTDEKEKPKGKAKLHEDFVQGKNRWENESVFRSKFLKNGSFAYELKGEFSVSESFGQVKEGSAKKGKFEDELPEDKAVTNEEIDGFFETKLVFAVHLPNEEKLGEILTSEIASEFKLIKGDFQSAYILKKMLDWFKSKDSHFMTAQDGAEMFKGGKDKMTQIRVTSASLDYQEELKHSLNLNISNDSVYSEEAILRLNEISKKLDVTEEEVAHTLIIITPSPRLSCQKINSALRFENGSLRNRFHKDDSYLMLSSDYFNNIKQGRNVKETIKTGDDAYQLVIICCDKNHKDEVPDAVVDLADDIQHQGGKKRIIILANNFDSQANKFEENEIKFTTVKDDFKFDDLDGKSRESVLEKNIIFQGQKISVKGLQLDVSSINSGALEELLTLSESELVIDSDPALNEDCCDDLYIDRTLSNPIVLDKSKTPSQFVDELDLSNQIDISGIGHINWRVEDTNEKRTSWKTLKEEAEKLKQNTKNKNKRKFTEGDLIVPSIGRVTLIADVAGTGKSTFLASLASKIRQNSPTSWVVRIKLNHKSRILDCEINFCNSDASEFLRDKLMGLDGDFAKFFFNHSFENGRVVLILDGFDEIKNTQQKNVINLVNQLKNRSSFYIASRPDAANDLQDEFFQFPFQLEDFTDDEQVKYLTRHWKREIEIHRNLESDALSENQIGTIKHFGSELVKVLGPKLLDTNGKNKRSFIGIPLQCFMVAECFQSKINEYILNANEPNVNISEAFFSDIIKPEFNLVKLYRQFLEKKMGNSRKGKRG